jgi:hypothetical protein
MAGVAGVAFVAAPPFAGVALVAGIAGVARVAFAGVAGAAATVNVAAKNAAAVRLGNSLFIFAPLQVVDIFEVIAQATDPPASSHRHGRQPAVTNRQRHEPKGKAHWN